MLRLLVAATAADAPLSNTNHLPRP
jgi:hypothetical protein